MDSTIEIPSSEGLTVTPPEQAVEVGAPAPSESKSEEKDTDKTQDSDETKQPEQVNEQEEAPEVSRGYYNEPYPHYFDTPNHRRYDYNKPDSHEMLPTADFNRKVYEFDESK